MSQFNRAPRRSGSPAPPSSPSSTSPALENGFTPSTIIVDAPVVIDQGPGLPQCAKPTERR
jgi:penicillin-binding protein 1A